ncbi:putative chromosome partitioning protein ParB [Desulfamplus magnetovallimortis]|uniref:Putative chromosome partitioning protein ParB n=1 Tax=Desulfamplus magnetovallimortis TaxID=1246637 RepID=A0A1W1HGP2_9BACT|nr:ParB/RepB/Spo0J family partition protein [Desulfamplus magnetovallimortis]SLM31667.1 putative chromosome partitioning protein ParB [Desulfamplus magnetovallimortis]
MSMKRKTGLGRGISSLIPDFDSLDEKSGDFFMCRIDDIVPNPFQPRRSFNEEELERLTLSIKEQGVLQPLLVRKDPKGGYELIAGERRLRAAKQAQLDLVPAIVRAISDEQMLEVSIIENVQRSNLNPIEEADAYHRLITEFNYTQEMVARKIGKNRSTIANFLRLRGLPEQVLESLAADKISMGHARAILSAGSVESQIKTWEIVIEKGLSVRATEQLAKKIKAEPPLPDQPEDESDPEQLNNSVADADYIKTICSDLTRRINYPVSIKKKGEKGKLEITFRDNREFQKIIDFLNNI